MAGPSLYYYMYGRSTLLRRPNMGMDERMRPQGRGNHQQLTTPLGGWVSDFQPESVLPRQPAGKCGMKAKVGSCVLGLGLVVMGALAVHESMPHSKHTAKPAPPPSPSPSPSPPAPPAPPAPPPAPAPSRAGWRCDTVSGSCMSDSSSRAYPTHQACAANCTPSPAKCGACLKGGPLKEWCWVNSECYREGDKKSPCYDKNGHCVNHGRGTKACECDGCTDAKCQPSPPPPTFSCTVPKDGTCTPVPSWNGTGAFKNETACLESYTCIAPTFNCNSPPDGKCTEVKGGSGAYRSESVCIGSQACAAPRFGCPTPKDKEGLCVQISAGNYSTKVACEAAGVCKKPPSPANCDACLKEGPLKEWCWVDSACYREGDKKSPCYGKNGHCVNHGRGTKACECDKCTDAQCQPAAAQALL